MAQVLDRLKTALSARYAIERELGSGGMATVYLATDLKHDRKVAVKVLRPELAAVLGAERFLNEIKVTAHLQHPHILPLHDSGEADSFLYYVMPFAQGESLRERLNREKHFSIEEALRITTAVASALDYAHRHGVIHRDIKPENVLLEEGQPLVADFGIALAVSIAGGGRLTETGLSLGTPQYMSPEQATGDRVLDGRTDIYSLGCVLYEMLAGEPPHTGPTAQAIIAKVLTERPRSIRAARETVPEHVEWAIDRALAKLPADRWATAQDFAGALEGRVLVPAVSVALTHGTTLPAAATEKRRISWVSQTWVPWAMAAAAAGGLLWETVRTSGREPGSVVRFEVMPESLVTFQLAQGRNVAVSSNPRRVVYRGTRAGQEPQLYLRALDELEAHPIPGTARAYQPFFSPDGDWLGFIADGKLQKVALSGGPPSVIANASDDARGASWSSDGTIVYVPASGSGLMRVPASGGIPVALTTPDAAGREVDHRWPYVLPDGKSVLFTLWRGYVESAEVGVVSVETGKVERLGPGTSPQYADGFLFAARPRAAVETSAQGIVNATRFDRTGSQLSGGTLAALDGILVKRGGAAEYTVSEDGALAYFSGVGTDNYLALVDRHGRERRLMNVPDLHPPRISPDGRRVAVVVGSAAHDVWVLDLPTGAFTRLTFGIPVDDANTSEPLWTPDGRRVLFQPQGLGLVLSRAADGSGSTDTVLRGDVGRPRAWLRAGKTLVTEHGSGRDFAESRELWAVDLESGADKPVVPPRGEPWEPAVSPDERWLAYTSTEAGQPEIYVEGLGGSGGRWQVSQGGGRSPIWTRDGRSLLYRTPQAVMSVPVTLGTAFTFGVPVALFLDSTTTHWDALPNGAGFVMLRTETTSVRNRLFVVQNWLEEVREQKQNEKR